MSMKRSRNGSSSSYAEAPVAAAASGGGGGSVKVMKTDPPPRPSFTADASPAKGGGPEEERIGGFLERCRYCKKRIAENSEVFMYRDLCAFCSAECRDSQIILDQSAKKKP